MTRFLRPVALAALGAVLALAACDSAPTADPADLTTDDAVAAAAVADALGMESAGLLDVLAADAMRHGPRGPHGPGHGPGHPPGQGGPPPPGGACDVDSTYDAGTVTTTVTVACARGTEGDPAYGWSSRTMTFAYAGPDGPQPGPDGATDLAYALVSGTALRVWPRGRNEITASSASLLATDLDRDTVTVNGTFSRDGASAFAGPRGGSVETEYALDLTLADVRGSRRVVGEDQWARGISGTVSGTYTATITRTAPNGTTVTQQVTRDILITLGHRPGRPRPLAAAVAEVRVGGRPFTADLRTGGLLP